MDTDAGSETHLEYSHNINEQLNVKEEEQDPVLITFPVMKVEVEDDINFTSAEIHADSEKCVPLCCTENERFVIKDGEDCVPVTCPVLKTENKRELCDRDKTKNVFQVEEIKAEDGDAMRGESLTEGEELCTATKDVPCSYVCEKGISQNEHTMGHTNRHITGNVLNSQNFKDGCSCKGNISRHETVCCNKSPFTYDNGKNEILKYKNELTCQKMFPNENGFRCDICSKMFVYKHNLVIHQRIHTNSRHFICVLCGKGFITSGKLARHQRTHTGEKCCECDICGKQFSAKFSLKRHLRIHSGEKLFVCETCGKAFSDRSNFLIHCSRYHGDEDPFKCDVCGKIVRERGSIERHQRKHSGENPFICDICGRNFFDKRDIVKHLKTHMSERPFVCMVCGRGFLEKRKLVRHQRTNSCKKPLKCDICGKLYSSRGSIQKHISTH